MAIWNYIDIGPYSSTQKPQIKSIQCGMSVPTLSLNNIILSGYDTTYSDYKYGLYTFATRTEIYGLESTVSVSDGIGYIIAMAGTVVINVSSISNKFAAIAAYNGSTVYVGETVSGSSNTYSILTGIAYGVKGSCIFNGSTSLAGSIRNDGFSQVFNGPITTASTTDLTPGSSALGTNCIYCVYE